MPKQGKGRELLGEVSGALGDLPGVFSTAQWGGRAWKRPVGSGSKSKVLAHVCLADDDRAVTVSFKLDPQRARDEVERRDWIDPHSFRTLAPSGWLTATVRTKRHLAAVRKLLAESYDVHGPPPDAPEADESETPAKRATNATARHIDRVMDEARKNGWQPGDDW